MGRPSFAEWLRLGALFLIQLPLDLLTPLVVPLACLFVRPVNGLNRLPAWARWWDEYAEGPDGDADWRAKYGDRVRRWDRRVAFLFRNRLNTFNSTVLGIRTSDITWMGATGDLAIGNKAGRAGSYRIDLVADGQRYFEYHLVRPWFNWPVCLRIRVGWKVADLYPHYLAGNFSNPDVVLKEGRQFVFAISPVMRFRKGIAV